MQSLRRHNITILDYQQEFSVCSYLYQRKLNKTVQFTLTTFLTDYFGWPKHIDVTKLVQSAMGQCDAVSISNMALTSNITVIRVFKLKQTNILQDDFLYHGNTVEPLEVDTPVKWTLLL